MRAAGIHGAALLLMVGVAGFAAFGARERTAFLDFERSHPYSTIAQSLNAATSREWCDSQEGPRRLFAAAVVDRFGPDIRALWRDPGAAHLPKFSLLDLGPLRLRVSPKLPASPGFDSSSWSWDEAYGLIQRTQADPDSPENLDRWRDVDSMVRYLTEKDYARLVAGIRFDAPEVTEHTFRPNRGVTRSGPREFRVALDPGELRGHEEVLRRVLEPEWQGEGYRVLIEWTQSADAYRVRAHFDSNRSFVSHRSRTLEIANLAWTKTVAHELGHVLGFDDHYYNVWNPRNCYYSQQSRLSDLMSNSEHGVVSARHWQILDRAYPWAKAPVQENFRYLYGK